MLPLLFVFSCEDNLSKDEESHDYKFEHIYLDTGITIDSKGYFHLTLDRNRWQTLYRVRGIVYRDDIPADSSKIIITINNQHTSNLVFDWTNSIDVENNELTYLFEFELKMVNINNETISYYDGKDLLYPGLIITYSDILENLDQFLSPGGIITWSVDVTDGIDTVYAQEERVIFVIGKYAALAVDGAIIPEEYSLNQNYPNPFNPTTRIQYSLPKAGLVQMSIYTLMGQKIATLVNRNMDAGRYMVIWNGMDDLGNPAGAGVYLYQLRANQYVETRKMVLLK